jgi:serine protease Do
MKTDMNRIICLLAAALALPLPRAAAQPSCRCAAGGVGAEGAPYAFAMSVADAAAEPDMIPFLGVETERASLTLTEQLGLPDNTGLVVEQIVPETAAASELKRHDILLKLDDQLLIEPRQLAVLVRSHKVGDSVTVTFLRAGKQQSATLKLGRHRAPDIGQLNNDDGPDSMPNTFHVRGISREDMDRMLSLMNNPPLEPPPPGDARSRSPGAPPNVNELSVDLANSNIVYTDDLGTLSLTIKDGRRTLDARDAHGSELFSGPIDTAEQRRALPPEVRGRLEKLRGMKEFSFKTDRDFQGADSRVARPEGQVMPVPPRLPESAQPPF